MWANTIDRLFRTTPWRRPPSSYRIKQRIPCLLVDTGLERTSASMAEDERILTTIGKNQELNVQTQKVSYACDLYLIV